MISARIAGSPAGDACQIWDERQLSGARRRLQLASDSVGGALGDTEFQKRVVTFLPSVAVSDAD